MTTKLATSLCAAVIAISVCLVGGCSDPNYGLKAHQIEDLKQWKEEGVNLVKKKDPATACGWGFVLGIGSFYNGDIGLGILDLLLWPISICWEPFIAPAHSNRINYEATQAEWRRRQRISPRDLSGVNCDLRVVRVADGTVICGASARGPGDKLLELTASLARQLKEKSAAIKGRTIAVISLKNRSGSDKGRAVADEMADKMTISLTDLGWFSVRERLDLTSVINERDLADTKIVNNPEVKRKLGGIEYVVIGAVSVSK